jgi:hypothetical protein
MGASDVFWLAIGLAIGWVTKIPFLLHIYREMEKKYADTFEMVNRLEKRVLDLKECATR